MALAVSLTESGSGTELAMLGDRDGRAARRARSDFDDEGEHYGRTDSQGRFGVQSAGERARGADSDGVGSPASGSRKGGSERGVGRNGSGKVTVEAP